jgi:hypothetical protein
MNTFKLKPNRLSLAIMAALPLFGTAPVTNAADITVDVVSPDAAGVLQAVNGFRWLVQENTTYHVVPGLSTTDIPSLKTAKTEANVVASGYSDAASVVISNLDPGKRYFVSILPYAGHAQNGGFVNSFTNDQAALTVSVNRTPIPTAQMMIQACVDMKPINNWCDLGEDPLANFTVTLTDAGGMYGYGGQILEDAFGNPLGTTYQFGTDGQPLMEADGITPVVDVMGTGIIKTDAKGFANIKYLSPGKYTAQVIPPAGSGWVQTNTIEGGKGIDGWLPANGSKFFWEFGLPSPHASFAFVNPAQNSLPTTGGSTVTGKVVNIHNGRPPNLLTGQGDGPAWPDCWVGLNENGAQGQLGRYVGPCKDDSTFEINNVPPGTWQIMTFDAANDMIVGFFTVTVPEDGSPVDMGNLPANDWFFHSYNYVFRDDNGDGKRDANEAGIPSRGINLRFPDGRVYQAGTTDLAGFRPFDETFPFFKWLVAEVDYTNMKPTGATVTVDAGGTIPGAGDPLEALTFGGRLNPQFQPDNVGCAPGDTNPECYQRTDISGNPLNNDYAPVLLEAFQGFAGQTNVIEWGKKPYAIGENGGIAGIVWYATTRAEDDARWAAADQWEPGIPRVQVNLYKCNNANGTNCGPAGRTLVNTVLTDSWDNSTPTGCVWDQPYNGMLGDGITTFTYDNAGPDAPNCFDGMRVWNQVRPGVFDGGYAFTQEYPSGGAWSFMTSEFVPTIPGETPVPLSQPQYYVVEVVPPAGYELVKEEDKNVELGDSWQPSTLAIPAECVGDQHVVPQYLSMQSYPNGNLLPGISPADAIASPFAGKSKPLCDKKKVKVVQGYNSAADFFLFTQVPKAAMSTGMVLNDVANAFNQSQPSFGEKASAAWIPISLRDWTGKEFGRIYTDEFGVFNTVMPTNHNVNIPQPSGLSPSMITSCMNDSGAVRNPAFNPLDPTSPPYILDPYFNPGLTQTCFTLQFIPGATTYLDTPVANNAAFAGQGRSYPADCEQGDYTPGIYSVVGSGLNVINGNVGNPHAGGAYVKRGEVVTLTSMGVQQVPNPRFGAPGEPATIARNFGFGATRGTGSITLNGTAISTSASSILSWNDTTIRFVVPSAQAYGDAEIIVTNDYGAVSPVGVTMIVGNTTMDARVRDVNPSTVLNDTPLQDAIDAANPGDILLVHPGAYDENPVVYKPLQIQGSGAQATVLNARVVGGVKLQRWQDKIDEVVANTPSVLLPGQSIPANGRAADIFATELGTGMLVLGARPSNAALTEFADFPAPNNARIDGLSITGGINGGGIFINGYADNLEISNNRITLNQGAYGGGIRVGTPLLVDPAFPNRYVDAGNKSIDIHNNHIAMNGGAGGVGGGISMYSGSSQYRITSNFVCGNFSQGDGGGIGHYGKSGAYGTNYSLIENNTVLFNQVFNQQISRGGGGIYVGGATPLGTNTLSEGSGAIRINRNLLQGNQAGSGEGGGLRIEYAHGQDTTKTKVEVTNNIVANNLAAMGGSGMSFQDVVGNGLSTSLFQVVQNTIVNNDSAAIAASALTSPEQDFAGVVSHGHSAALTAVGASVGTISNPNLRNNIIWHNRYFKYCLGQPDLSPSCSDPNKAVLLPDIAGGEAAIYKDIAVIGSNTRLNPVHNVLSSVYANGSNNSTNTNPVFVNPVVNGQREASVNSPFGVSNIEVSPAVDEGGNAIDVRYGPLTRFGSGQPGTPGRVRMVNYHLAANNPSGAGGVVNRSNMSAQTSGANLATRDFDNATRPSSTGSIDVGADEYAAATGGAALLSVDTTAPTPGARTRILNTVTRLLGLRN